MADPFDIFLVVVPGLEAEALAEARAAGFDARPEPGGVLIRGGWPEVWRANRQLRGPTRVLARIGAFRAMHLAQLDKRARKFDWAAVLRPDQPVRVEATCKASRIYHAGAAAQRVAVAIAETLGAPVSHGAAGPEDAPETPAITLKVRIDDDLVTLSVDASGAPLHKRGFKTAVAKAPMRETMAAMILTRMGFDGTQTVLDPMCGSGTFVIEAAEMAAGLWPGRARPFADMRLATRDEGAASVSPPPPPRPAPPAPRFFGRDRDPGAIRMSAANADRAGVAGWTDFAVGAVADLVPPPHAAPGIVIANPPYGTRIGNGKGPLYGLHAAFGTALKARFAGWRVGIVTSDAGLAKATGLPFGPPGPVIAHGGLKVRLWQTGPL